jgi:hypothetical protein
MTYADTSYYEGEWLGGKRVTGKLVAGELARVRVRVTVQGAQMLVIQLPGSASTETGQV